jgi:hypothetical protein
MTLSKRWIALPGLWFTLAIAAPVPAQAVTSDDTILKQIIIFGRHSVRSPIISPASYAQYSPRPYPDFGVPPGYLTIHGQQAEVLLGAYYRSYLLSEGLLTGDTRRPVPAPAATAVPRRDRRHAEGDARRGGRCVHDRRGAGRRVAFGQSVGFRRLAYRNRQALIGK